MFENLSQTVSTISQEDDNLLFGDLTKNDNAGVKKSPNPPKEKDSEDSKNKEKKPTSDTKAKPVIGKDVNKPLSAFAKSDEDAFEEDDENSEDTDDDDKNLKDSEDIDEDSKDTDNDENSEDTDDDKNSEDGPVDVKDFIKARVNLLMDKGEWEKFKDWEDYEWDEESFADMEMQQREYRRNQDREELLESFGPYGKQIAEFASKGGDPDKLIDIFKEQQRIESLSIDTEDQQRAVVMKYETEFLNKKPERVRKYIDSLIADKELKDAATEAKESMDEALRQQTDALQQEQSANIARADQQRKQNIQKFASDVTGAINSLDEVSSDEKKQLISVLTKFDKKLKNGALVNDFYFKFEQFRKDLPNYIQLVRFVLNPSKFVSNIEQSGKNKAAEKAFRLVRTANDSKKIKSAAQDDRSGKSTTSKFKLL